MRRPIGRLPTTAPPQPTHGATLPELMRDVLHRVAHEDTVMRPEVEHIISGRLDELGGTLLALP